MNGLIVWFCGLPSSGKTTLANSVERVLRAEGRGCCVLDGDEVRNCLSPRFGYGPGERDDFYRTLANLAGMLARQEFTVLVAATAHRRHHRDTARGLAPGEFLEVFVDTPPAECEKRDAKGLYARARVGEINHFPGVQEPFEAPNGEALRLTGDDLTAAAGTVLAAIRARRPPSRSGDTR